MLNQYCRKHGFSWMGTPQAIRLHLDQLRATTAEATTDVIVRTYSGPNANDVFEAEAQVLAEFGFYPVAQSGATSTTGPGGTALLLGGLVAFASRTSKSTLTVTFRRGAKPAAVSPTPTGLSLRDRLTELEDARTAGLLTDEEYATRRARILDNV